jgi:uncharacterized phiE125 gp8 family phage protein
MASNITTKEKVKTYLGLSGTTYDTLIDELIKNVTASIEKYCNRSFTETTYTEYFDTTAGDTKIFLQNFPISSLTSVQYRGGTWGSITWLDLNTNDYLLNTNGKVSLAFCLPQAEKYIKIVYIAGYKIDFTHETDTAYHTLPYELTQIATDIVATQFNQRTSLGVSSESTEGQSISYKDTDLTKSYQSKLLSYRNINI